MTRVMSKLKAFGIAKKPEILFGVSTLSGVGALYFTAKGAPKAAKARKEFRELENERKEIKEIIEYHEDPDYIAELEEDGYTDRKQYFDNRKWLVKEYAKAYAPAAGMAALSFGTNMACFKEQKARYLGAVAVAEATSIAYNAYRERVKEEVGEEIEDRIYHGIKKVKKEEEYTDEKGKTKTREVEEEVKTVRNPNNISQYARFFDESHPEWDHSPEINLLYLRACQERANIQLRRDGYIFLNDVYRIIRGIEPSEEGQYVGWLLGNGDNVVDFGLYDDTRPGTRDFVNGYNNSILLDFNVDGIIVHKLDNLNGPGKDRPPANWRY